ncbi:Mor transcription activator family protein [Aquimixticola soesokkakensis]|uniref:Mor transcription activator family protein n=1 Tax=Aquimixticola soesokkakensis TaxID=1519096 RepID=A0A1Y5SFD5_9RHOB|nr:hypothetical protein [Aquimixticola soesokkakensis]SLN38307.1 Mor transcription activator family protein [Aquimixticola soesokkakensis]
MVEGHDLPSSLWDVADVFGLGVTLKLMQHYGGQDVLFPKRIREGHEWIGLFGEDVAHELCHFLSGQRMYVPNGKPLQMRTQVKKLEMIGKKRNEMSRMLGISERHIRRLSKAEPPPTPLFPDLDD